MPSLHFVLPHWLYWGTLIVFPLLAWYFVRRQRRLGLTRRPSLFIAYLFWLCSGFLGLHRFYLKSAWAFVFIPVFLAILYLNGQIRDAREDVSRTRAAYEAAASEVKRAQPLPGVELTPERAARLAKAETAASAAKADLAAMEGELDSRHRLARWLAVLLAAMLLVDAALLPAAVRHAAEREAASPALPAVEPPVADIPPAGTQEDPTLGLHTRFTDAIETVTRRVGEFVAFWAVLSVFAYYYEVIARFAFNSPTNWVHESMFLMYGMQYMLAGAYAYLADQHVRVDVFYTKFSPRGKAMADIVTSAFFFIFVLTLLWTGGRFALDAINNTEVSFTEWGVEYWPVKLMIPIGAALLALQGLAKLTKDIVLLARARA
jgi:TRAP-type mannitol/chloroaromatic compound transport system permease small subunit